MGMETYQCSTVLGEHLVTVIRDDKKPSQFLRYSGSDEKQNSLVLYVKIETWTSVS